MRFFKARKYTKESEEPQFVELGFKPGKIIERGQRVRREEEFENLDNNANATPSNFASSASLEADSSALLSTVDTDQELFTLDLTGDSGQRIKLSIPSTGVTYIVSDPEFLDVWENSGMSEEIQAVVRNTRQKLKSVPVRAGAWLFGSLAAIALLAVVFYGTFDFWVSLAVDKIPPSAESALGSALIKSERFEENTESSKRIERIGKSLVAKLENNPYDFEFRVRTTDDVNAYAYPGGKIVVLSKLIDQADSDDELAGVLGHEIGHVINRDSLRRAVHGSGFSICLSLIFGGAINSKELKLLLPALEHFDRTNYSKAQESLADSTGVRLAFDAGYDPEAQIAFFERLDKEFEKLGSMGQAAMSMMSEHPMPKTRIAEIRREAQALKIGSSQSIE